MAKPRICLTVIERNDRALAAALPSADLVELRLDLLGGDWRQIAPKLNKPWIACNRRRAEGGKAAGDEKQRQAELLEAVAAGAAIVDIEYRTPGLGEFIECLSKRTRRLISYHDFHGTPSLSALAKIVDGQLKAGAQICKVVTSAREFGDNLILLELIRKYAQFKIVAFAMGEAGAISRVLSPLAGGYCTYASVGAGKEAASGQISIHELRRVYRLLEK